MRTPRVSRGFSAPSRGEANLSFTKINLVLQPNPPFLTEFDILDFCTDLLTQTALFSNSNRRSQHHRQESWIEPVKIGSSERINVLSSFLPRQH